MENARAKAILLLGNLLMAMKTAEDTTHREVEDVVDALIAAARAPESSHTRAVRP